MAEIVDVADIVEGEVVGIIETELAKGGDVVDVAGIRVAKVVSYVAELIEVELAETIIVQLTRLFEVEVIKIAKIQLKISELANIQVYKRAKLTE
jgi:hypothetical protein